MIKKEDEYNGIYIYGEINNNKLIDITYELLSKGRPLADKLNSKLNLVCINQIKDDDFKVLQRYRVDEVICYNYSNEYDCSTYGDILEKFVEKYKPDVLLFPATNIGRELAPFLASKCHTGITADCTMLEIDENTKLLRQTRPTFGGKMLATIIIPNNKPQICTVRQGIFDKVEQENETEPKMVIENINIGYKSSKTIIEKNKRVSDKQIDLRNAEIIIAGGMGLKNKDGFELLGRLAKVLGGEIGATRACVDAGWIDKKYQIGQTGISVKPKIYIACGISGAIQHTAGIKNANYIIAINSDKNAPIFEIADYGIVGDLYEIIPKLISKLGG